uniref:Uncharacterized protein n=1 Tax=Knipowitschia caucasica TaxID=637954 RepID=A0AAV2MPF9_KNICA
MSGQGEAAGRRVGALHLLVRKEGGEVCCQLCNGKANKAIPERKIEEKRFYFTKAKDPGHERVEACVLRVHSERGT